MEVIDYKGYRFLKVCESPNIVISLNSAKQFCNLSEEGKQDLLNQAFGLSAFNEFTQVHGTSIFNLDLNTKEYDGYIERELSVANAMEQRRLSAKREKTSEDFKKYFTDFGTNEILWKDMMPNGTDSWASLIQVIGISNIPLYPGAEVGFYGGAWLSPFTMLGFAIDREHKIGIVPVTRRGLSADDCARVFCAWFNRIVRAVRERMSSFNS